MPNYTTPCPSPRGTNIERLYIVRKPERMAMDAAIGGPDDNDSNVDGSDDLADKVYQLLAGKLEPADLEALIKLIQPDDDEPMPAQDRGRRGMATDAFLQRRVSTSIARRTQAEIASVVKRFPALKNARVVG